VEGSSEIGFQLAVEVAAADDGREDPTPTDTDIPRVARGGSWFNISHSSRATYSGWNFPHLMFHMRGFRCARDVAS
jgi:formylglycine-generating enzyme required for sulfatase activity